MAETRQGDQTSQLYCSFWLGEHCFAVPSSTVSEVHAPAPLTWVPGAALAVRGYVNLRGQLNLVLDPAALLLGESQPAEGENELIVFRAEIGESFAIAVERVGDMLEIPGSQIHVPKSRTDDLDLSDETHRIERLIVGHATLDSLLVTLIEPRELLSAAVGEGSRRSGAGEHARD